VTEITGDCDGRHSERRHDSVTLFRSEAVWWQKLGWPRLTNTLKELLRFADSRSDAWRLPGQALLGTWTGQIQKAINFEQSWAGRSRYRPRKWGAHQESNLGL